MIGIAILSCQESKKEKLSNGYIVTGKVKGLNQAVVKLIEFNFADRGAQRVIIDSAQMTNGFFEFKGTIVHPDKVLLMIDDDYSTDFFLENSNIYLELDLIESDHGRLKAKVSGSDLQDHYDVQQAKLDSIVNQDKFKPLKAIRPKMEAAYKSKNEDEIKAFEKWRTQFSSLENQQKKERKDFMIKYVKEHPHSPVAPWVLGFQFSEGRMSKSEIKDIYPIFKEASKHTAMFRFYEKTFNDLFINLGIGSIAPDFSLNDIKGERVSLKRVNAKYKLVDFWASWCVPCRASFPHLKELYQKYYEDGFEIVGIGTADEEDNWRKAIEEDQLPWIHLYDTSAEHQWGKIALQYGVPFLPTTFLMDENEEIVLRNPTKEELDTKLKELFSH